MDESSKLSALQKAYAEMITNVSKEASYRVMASEKKRLCLQQELSAVKDEGLHLLMRLKQILDDKTNEAEMASISKRKRIDELEAKLHEAKDVAKELRGELHKARAEPVKVTTNRLSSSNETCTGPVAASAGKAVGKKPGIPKYSHKAYIYVHSSEFSSRIVGIQAFGRDIYGQLSLPRNEDDKKNGVQRSGETDASCTTPNLSPDQPFGMEEDPDDLEPMETTEIDGKSLRPEAFKSCPVRRKRTTRYWMGEKPISRSSLDSDGTLRLASDSEQVEVQLEHPISSGNTGLVKPCSFRNTMGSSKISIGSARTRLVKRPLGSRAHSVGRLDSERSENLSSDVGVSNLRDPVLENGCKGRFLKYTFQRRQKKDKSRYSSVGRNTPKIEMNEEHNGPRESDADDLDSKSSVMEVAEQLMTLSQRA